MRFARVVLLCIAMIGARAYAQSEAPSVMKEDQVSQRALIDALTPVQPVRTRSLRVVREAPVAGPPPTASLLVTFDTNSARLTPAARKALDVVAQALGSDQLAGHRFMIEGHADPRGTADANLKLSRERAEAVRDYLGSKGIDQARLQALGKGDKELIKPADPAAPENRRVTFVTVQ